MWGPRTCVAAGVALLALGAIAGRAHPAATSACAPRLATASYTSSVQQALASGRDLWGGELLRARGGPTYAAARRFLTPLTQAMQWQGRPLTSSGTYYVPLSFPFTSYGSTVFALHVADGSETFTRLHKSAWKNQHRMKFGPCRPPRPPAQ